MFVESQTLIGFPQKELYEESREESRVEEKVMSRLYVLPIGGSKKGRERHESRQSRFCHFHAVFGKQITK